MNKEGIGIDVSKAVLDYFKNKEDLGIIKNTISSIKKFLRKQDPERHFIVVEPTGTYSDKIIVLSSSLGFEVRLVDPKKSHYYSRMVSAYNKTDKIAAQLLCQLAQQIELPLYKAETESMKARKQLQMALSALQKQAGMLKSQLHALDQYLLKNHSAKKSLEKALNVVEQEIESLEKELNDLEDKEAQNFVELATSVTGIGSKTARMLLIYTNGFNGFEQAGKVVKYTGIAPSIHQSGSSVRMRARITKNGPAALRASLYMAANAARRFNNACKTLFERLRKKGKPYKVAMIAVMRKLIRQCFAVVKSGIMFDNQLFLVNKN